MLCHIFSSGCDRPLTIIWCHVHWLHSGFNVFRAYRYWREESPWKFCRENPWNPFLWPWPAFQMCTLEGLPHSSFKISNKTFYRIQNMSGVSVTFRNVFHIIIEIWKTQVRLKAVTNGLHFEFWVKFYRNHHLIWWAHFLLAHENTSENWTRTMGI